MGSNGGAEVLDLKRRAGHALLPCPAQRSQLDSVWLRLAAGRPSSALSVGGRADSKWPLLALRRWAPPSL